MLPDGWRTELARRVVADWIRVGPAGVPAAVLTRAETIFL